MMDIDRTKGNSLSCHLNRNHLTVVGSNQIKAFINIKPIYVYTVDLISCFFSSKALCPLQPVFSMQLFVQREALGQEASTYH